MNIVEKVTLSKEKQSIVMHTIDENKERNQTEIPCESVPMLLQMLLSSYNQSMKNVPEEERKVLANHLEGWQFFSLPEDFQTKGIGMHLECSGGFSFTFVINSDQKDRTPDIFAKHAAEAALLCQEDAPENMSSK